MICMKKVRFPSRLRANVGSQRPLGSLKAQPWYQCGVCIKQFEFREKVRTFFPQGQSKLSVIMRMASVHIKWVSVTRGLTFDKQNKRTCWTWF